MDFELVSNDQFQPRYVYDTHGNQISIDSILQFKRDLAISPTIPDRHCNICFKDIKKGLCHSRCSNVMTKLEKAKQKVLFLEFKLFCLKYTNRETINLETDTIDGGSI